MLVMTPISGAQMCARRAISPGMLVPSSRITHSCSGASRNRVSGTPIWLLRLRSASRTLKRWETTAAVIRRVLVLPLDPVMATTAARLRWRWNAPRSPRARVVSATAAQASRSAARAASGSASRCRRSTSRPRTPRPSTSGMKRWPSWTSPWMATNSSPAAIMRESIDMPVKLCRPSPHTRSAPVAFSMSCIVQGICYLKSY